MPLDREQAFDAIARAREEIEVKGVGKLMVRSLSQAEVGHVLKLTESDDPQVRLSAGAYIVSRCVLAPDGARMFKDDEVERLLDQDAEAISAIAIAIRKVSKLGPEEVAAEGESSAATSQPASS